MPSMMCSLAPAGPGRVVKSLSTFSLRLTKRLVNTMVGNSGTGYSGRGCDGEGEVLLRVAAAGGDGGHRTIHGVRGAERSAPASAADRARRKPVGGDVGAAGGLR